ncbi:Protein TRANSPARENT TESTA 16 [Zea mays]|uniref:Protein TRANSPARENT TESTA 16 n=1 Tax=Zea mays TaxID=4577 RepID=A0A1D6KJS6_MAIZE|nr:Protein TRANSPARENT TESTA 16 [Zea mays]
MGRGKVELKKIENPTNRQVTFSKRQMGLFKKENEVAILCDAQIGVIVFSGSGRMYEYSSPPWRIASVFDRYLKAPSTRFEEMDIQQKIVQEMTRMKDERNRLRMIMAQYMAEDLASFSAQDLSNLEQQIEFSLYKVRLRKIKERISLLPPRPRVQRGERSRSNSNPQRHGQSCSRSAHRSRSERVVVLGGNEGTYFWQIVFAEHHLYPVVVMIEFYLILCDLTDFQAALISDVHLFHSFIYARLMCVLELSSKKATKGNKPSKGRNRFWRNIGLGFKIPKEAIKGSFGAL